MSLKGIHWKVQLHCKSFQRLSFTVQLSGWLGLSLFDRLLFTYSDTICVTGLFDYWYLMFFYCFYLFLLVIIIIIIFFSFLIWFLFVFICFYLCMFVLFILNQSVSYSGRSFKCEVEIFGIFQITKCRLEWPLPCNETPKFKII